MSLQTVDGFSTGSHVARQRDEQRRVDRRRTESLTKSLNLRLRWGGELEKPGPRSLPAEIAFLADAGVPTTLLHYAVQLARRQGVSPDEALLGEGLVEEEVFYRALAEYLHADFLSGESEIDRPDDVMLAASRGFARLAPNPEGLIWLFAPQGEAIVRLIGAARASNRRPIFALRG